MMINAIIDATHNSHQSSTDFQVFALDLTEFSGRGKSTYIITALIDLNSNMDNQIRDYIAAHRLKRATYLKHHVSLTFNFATYTDKNGIKHTIF